MNIPYHSHPYVFGCENKNRRRNQYQPYADTLSLSTDDYGGICMVNGEWKNSWGNGEAITFLTGGYVTK